MTLGPNGMLERLYNLRAMRGAANAVVRTAEQAELELETAQVTRSTAIARLHASIDALDAAALVLRRAQRELVNAEAQLARLVPGWPRSTWSQVIAEKRATYACTPDRARPAGPRLAPGVYLAGDYVDAEFPATLEAAVRSGVAAAQAWHADTQ